MPASVKKKRESFCKYKKKKKRRSHIKKEWELHIAGNSRPLYGAPKEIKVWTESGAPPDLI